MACPTRREYEEALKNKKYLYDIISGECEHRDSLINELCASQKLLDRYKESLDYQKEIIQKYEIYQGLEDIV